MTLLQPLRPPGNAQRKALARAPEIQRLRAEGYTIEAIREALVAEGVVVSWSTVQREASRPARVEAGRRASKAGGFGSRASTGVGAAAPANSVEPNRGSSPAHVEREKSLDKDTRSPQEIAAEFMKGVNTNPLLQPKKGK